MIARTMEDLLRHMECAVALPSGNDGRLDWLQAFCETWIPVVRAALDDEP